MELMTINQPIIFPRQLGYRIAKRAMDIALCLLILPVALPIMAVCALAIYFDSSGPVVFVQQYRCQRRAGGRHCSQSRRYRPGSRVLRRGTRSGARNADRAYPQRINAARRIYHDQLERILSINPTDHTGRTGPGPSDLCHGPPYHD